MLHPHPPLIFTRKSPGGLRSGGIFNVWSGQKGLELKDARCKMDWFGFIWTDVWMILFFFFFRMQLWFTCAWCEMWWDLKTLDAMIDSHIAYYFDSCFRTILGENGILQVNEFLFQSTWKQKLMICPLLTRSLVMILIPFFKMISVLGKYQYLAVPISQRFEGIYWCLDQHNWGGSIYAWYHDGRRLGDTESRQVGNWLVREQSSRRLL